MSIFIPSIILATHGSIALSGFAEDGSFISSIIVTQGAILRLSHFYGIGSLELIELLTPIVQRTEQR
jgi:hypothetical protein